MALKKAPRYALVALAVGSLIGGVRYAANHGLIPSSIGKVIAPKHFEDLAPVEDA